MLTIVEVVWSVETGDGLLLLSSIPEVWRRVVVESAGTWYTENVGWMKRPVAAHSWVQVAGTGRWALIECDDVDGGAKPLEHPCHCLARLGTGGYWGNRGFHSASSVVCGTSSQKRQTTVADLKCLT